MEELKQDVIAGIGDRTTNSNIIYPYFDATIRKFIVGKDCIIDGLELSSDGRTITAGHCMREGFVGELTENITFGVAPSKIYGRFIVNHAGEYTSDTDLDHFYVVSDPVSGVRYDDILNEKGEYWLLLYDNGERKVDRNYPENAVNSDNSNRLIAGGTIAANAEVEGDTKSGDTSDKTVASTAWVQKVVQEEIGYDKQEIKYYVDTSESGADKVFVGTITVEKKADFVIMNIDINGSTLGTLTAVTNLYFFFDTDTIKYPPVQEEILFVPCNFKIAASGLLTEDTVNGFKITVSTSGKISEYRNWIQNDNNLRITRITYGWKINV